MRLKTFCAIGLGVYALLSAADLLLTISLLKTSGEAYEANPAAAACLEQHGWGGLAAFKAGGVLMFFGAVYLLARRKPGVAAGVVTFGCGVLLAVTLYSHALIRQAHAEDAEWQATKVRNSAPVDPGHPARHRRPVFAIPANEADRGNHPRPGAAGRILLFTGSVHHIPATSPIPADEHAAGERGEGVRAAGERLQGGAVDGDRR